MKELVQDGSIGPPDNYRYLERSNLQAPMFDLIEGEMEFLGLECSLTEHRTKGQTDCLDYESSVAVE